MTASGFSAAHAYMLPPSFLRSAPKQPCPWVLHCARGRRKHPASCLVINGPWLLRAQVFLEDAGFDWKILGPDVAEADHVAWTCDQDAYACSGQKCSAQSILFMHANWARAGALGAPAPRGMTSPQEVAGCGNLQHHVLFSTGCES